MSDWNERLIFMSLSGQPEKAEHERRIVNAIKHAEAVTGVIVVLPCHQQMREPVAIHWRVFDAVGGAGKTLHVWRRLWPDALGSLEMQQHAYHRIFDSAYYVEALSELDALKAQCGSAPTSVGLECEPYGRSPVRDLFKEPPGLNEAQFERLWTACTAARAAHAIECDVEPYGSTDRCRYSWATSQLGSRRFGARMRWMKGTSAEVVYSLPDGLLGYYPDAWGSAISVDEELLTLPKNAYLSIADALALVPPYAYPECMVHRLWCNNGELPEVLRALY